MLESAEKYLTTLARRKNTIRTYRFALRDYFEVTDEVSESAYEKFLITLKDYQPSTKRVKIAAVAGYYDYLDAWTPKLKKLNDHYIERIKNDPVNFNREAIEKVIAYCQTLHGGLMELRDRAFVLTLADSGLRISEICGLKRGAIDWQDERAIVIRKRGKKRFVRFSRRSTKALKDYLTLRAKLDGATGKPLNSLPLLAQHGNINKLKPITIDGMRKAIKERAKQCGVDPKEIRIHDFRHYFVTMLVIAKGLKIAKELADHERIETTDRYAHFAETELDLAYDDVFNQPPPGRKG